MSERKMNEVLCTNELWQNAPMDHPGEVTRKWRKEAKLTLPKLAELSGVDKGTISRFERGGDYRQEKFEAICRALGKTKADVYAVLAADAGKKLQATGNFLCGIPEHENHFRLVDEALHRGLPLEAMQRGMAALMVVWQPGPLYTSFESKDSGALFPEPLRITKKRRKLD